MTQPFKLGVNGYAFLTNNNGEIMVSIWLLVAMVTNVVVMVT